MRGRLGDYPVDLIVEILVHDTSWLSLSDSTTGKLVCLKDEVVWGKV